MSAGKLPLVALVGRPNVGKSALFNRIARRRLAIVEDTPGVTRDRLYTEVEWSGRRFGLVDTGGYVPRPQDPLTEQVRWQAEQAVQEADVVVLVVDAQTGRLPADHEVAEVLRRSGKPVVVAVNKVDTPGEGAAVAAEFFALGLGDPLPVSALHGLRVGELLDRMVAHLPAPTPEEVEEEPVRVSVVGRPNVGKSSLVNALVGSPRVVVDERPGTTRDAVDTYLRHRDRPFVLVDTAGLRRRARVTESLEFYSVRRAEQALERSHVAILVVDAWEGVTDQDQRIAREVTERGKALVVAANKWDLVKGPLAEERVKQLYHALRHVAFAPVLFVSAKTGRNVARLLDAALRVDRAHALRVPTGPLNRAVEAAEAAHPAPADARGRPLKIYYATQVSTRPPTVALFVNHPEVATEAYLRHLEARLRERFDFEGTPIRFVLRARRPRRGKME
ncbi:MAG: ribosome biogenesis GTPase Der [Armatimonadota bacterium]|nr:ribosome biogenesis GTPase Der [Armatimonadota bacterium]